jgi:molybdate-binding protein
VRLLLLDGHSLAYRAFFALPVENFSTTTGQPTNAVYGFTSMFINVLRDEQPTHLAVAAAVAAGRADAGLGVMAAARAFGLGFVPVAREPFDLVMAPDEPVVEPLLALLADPEFRAQVEALGGYSVTETGRRVA